MQFTMKIVYKSSDITEAHIVQGMLDAHGIEAYVGGHYLQGGVGELLATDYASIYVADDDVSAAMALIVEYENSEPYPDDYENEIAEDRAEQELVTRVETKVFIPGMLMIILSVLFMLLIYHLVNS